jgi:hypothetical protein
VSVTDARGSIDNAVNSVHASVHLTLLGKTFTILAHMQFTGGLGPEHAAGNSVKPTANPENRYVITGILHCILTNTADTPSL